MKTRKTCGYKVFILIGLSLMMTLFLAGCSNASSSGGPNGAVNLPDNLRNTTWTLERENSTLVFEEYTIKLFYHTNPDDPRNAQGFGVFAASENGEIKTKDGDETVWQYMETEVLCSSYSITGDKLQLNFPPNARATYTDHYIQRISEEYDLSKRTYLGYATWTRKQ